MSANWTKTQEKVETIVYVVLRHVMDDESHVVYVTSNLSKAAAYAAAHPSYSYTATKMVD